MNSPLTDFRDRDDIVLVVTEFYERVFVDELLGPIFVDVAKMDLEYHIPIICDFWETSLFRAGRYQRNALKPHVDLNALVTLEWEHFVRWLELWKSTVDAHFRGPKADLAKRQADRVAGSIHRRLQGESGSEFVTIGTRDGL